MGTQETCLSFESRVIGKTVTNTWLSVLGLWNKEIQVQRKSFSRALPRRGTTKQQL